MAVEFLREPDHELTTLVASGPVLDGEFGDALTRFYATAPTRFLLWDLSNADLTGVSADKLRMFVSKGAKLGSQRAGGRTAVVAPHDVAFGYGRMSEAFMVSEKAAFDFRVFRTKGEARSWLLEADNT